MSDIELVIKLPEEIVTDIRDYCGMSIADAKEALPIILNAIHNGTPLPKGHGRLMILSEDKLKENQINLDFSCQKWISEVGLSNATVAILEGKKNENKNI